MKFETFSEEVKLNVYNAQHSYCTKKGCTNQIHSFHHQLHNTKYHRLKFPLFIHSPFNCIGLCQQCHSNFHYLFEINENIAKVYEDYLRELKEGNFL